MIYADRYNRLRNENITEDKFPVKGEGCVEFEYAFFSFDHPISSKDAVVQITTSDSENPWEPAKIEHLLAYGVKNPEVQRKYLIIALGSIGEVDGKHRVPYLYGSGAGRWLSLDFWGCDWNDNPCFLAVRKKTSLLEIDSLAPGSK